MDHKNNSKLLTFWFFLLIWTSPVHLAQRFNELTVDISEDCQNNYTTSIHLSYGAGAADARIILLNSAHSFDRCSVLVVSPDSRNGCKDHCVVVVVIEFLTYHLLDTICDSEKNGIYLKSKEKYFENVCADISNRTSTKNRLKHNTKAYLVDKEAFFVDINFQKWSGNIRMTLTGARYLGKYPNCTTKELSCVLHGQIFCIDKVLECDGNLNCGTPNMYDEYCENFSGQENIPYMVIYGIILVAVLLFFCIQILRICVPTVADHFFIFKEDQDYNFVLTSQSLPPIKIISVPDEDTDRPSRMTRATDNQIY